eukprot:CAMPEP_0178436416 /NCGR_PEP_ID=MMETSP0689_2-20121128/34428_1 /TAXON_ID=160604 /ORGANISM="Amphidinium massartii, Strain CS-259" /LENGTH=585 /DNA_ID=CAMNT_0020058511 /DNA_START=95 /DNA_END=1852 /DNA_ORIENTATION=+
MRRRFSTRQLALLQVLLTSYAVGVSGTDTCGGSHPQATMGVSMLQTARSGAQVHEQSKHRVKKPPMSFEARLDRNSEVSGAPALSAPPTCLATDSGCVSYYLEDPHAHQEMKGVELVITRYEEDVTWLDSLPDIPAIVYNKGGLSTLLPTPRANLRIENVANRGREDETMMLYIIGHYDSLPETVVFLQGWPYNHCGSIGKAVRGLVLEAQAHQNGADMLVPLTHTFWDYRVQEGLNGLATQLLTVHGVDANTLEEHRVSEELELFSSMCSQILGEPCPRALWVAEGAQWIVGRNKLRATSKESYARALALDEGYQGEYRGLVMEALWPILWGHPGWIPEDSMGKDGVEAALTKSPYVAGMMRIQLDSEHCTSPLYDVLASKRIMSCQSNMGFCALLRYLDHGKPVSSSRSLAFEHALDESFLLSFGAGRQDSMLLLLEADLPGQSSLLRAVDGNAVVSKHALGNAQWMITSGSEALNVYLQTAEGSNTSYLGCGEQLAGQPYNIPVILASKPSMWRMEVLGNGKVAFKGPSGYFLCLSRTTYMDYAGRNTSSINVVCSTTEECVPSQGRGHNLGHWSIKSPASN